MDMDHMHVMASHMIMVVPVVPAPLADAMEVMPIEQDFSSSCGTQL